MTVEEFSNEFDVLVSSYRRFKSYDDQEILDSIEFNEYEKSVFLTKAQEDILIELYSGNGLENSFEQTEEIRRYLESLNKKVIEKTSTYTKYLNKYDCLEYSLADDAWFITYEVIYNTSDTKLVTPVNRDSLYNTLQNPFKTSKARCLRVDGDKVVYIYGSNIKDSTYEYHYIGKPTPIILAVLKNASINNISVVTECTVHPALHRKILERAVALALQSKVIVNNKND